MQVSAAQEGFFTPKNVIAISVVMLVAAAVFGLLNGRKVKALHADVAAAESARDTSERAKIAAEKEAKARAQAVVEATAKLAEAESKATAIQAELSQLQTEKNDLAAKIQASQAEIASLQAQIAAAGGTVPGAHPDNPGAASPVEMQAQLDEARRQLESAERENAFLSEKIRSAEEEQKRITEERKRRQMASSARPGIRGTVLAVNQAYNFVVLNLGGRNGVETGSVLMIVREGNVIGKIRISSVEPSTAIGDIISSSLERGVSVQPGDVVIYAGVNS